jgi:hypothetical protein
MSNSNEMPTHGLGVPNKTRFGNGAPRYLASGAPDLSDYYPTWLDNLADDVTVEGSMLDGDVEGADAVRAIIVGIRDLYGDTQEFHFAGPWNNNVWVEDYIARVGEAPLGCVVVVTRNNAGQTQHIAASYRPRTSLLFFSRLLGEKFVDAPYATQLASGSE